MNKIEQGVQQQNKLVYLLVTMLLLFTFGTTQILHAESSVEVSLIDDTNTPAHRIFIISQKEHTQYEEISQQLSDNLKRTYPDIIISKKILSEKMNNNASSSADIIIAIGENSILSAKKYFPKTKKLFISTAPNKFRISKKSTNAVLYMTPPYCQQLKFIKQLNTKWQTISILNNQKNPVNISLIRQCEKNNNITIHTVNISSQDNLTNKIKDALNHSDVLLALPDRSIYNRKTVKNILLTSYRHRKPVIGFSKNYVKAGALGSIYSNTKQIAKSASKLIEEYYNAGMKFKKTENHPNDFDISINKQVFRALDIKTPDTSQLKKQLMRQSHKESL